MANTHDSALGKLHVVQAENLELWQGDENSRQERIKRDFGLIARDVVQRKLLNVGMPTKGANKREHVVVITVDLYICEAERRNIVVENLFVQLTELDFNASMLDDRHDGERIDLVQSDDGRERKSEKIFRSLQKGGHHDTDQRPT